MKLHCSTSNNKIMVSFLHNTYYTVYTKVAAILCNISTKRTPTRNILYPIKVSA